MEKARIINFSLTIDEATLILKALGALPFSEVYELVGKFNAQANQQLGQDLSNTATPGPEPE